MADQMSFFFSDRQNHSTNLETLSSVVLVPVSEEAYLTAAQHPDSLRQLLRDDRVLRQGESIEVMSTGGSQVPHSLVYILWSLEPVSQGRALAGQTEIIILYPGRPIFFPRNNVTREPDVIEINEGFLASSDVPAYPFYLKALDVPEDLLQDHFSLYVRTSDLGKIGILSNDWVCSQPSFYMIFNMFPGSCLLESFSISFGTRSRKRRPSKFAVC